MQVNLHWNKCKGDVWGDLATVDTTNSHFDGMEGVIAAWTGGSAPSPLIVAYGNIRDEITRLRGDVSVDPFRAVGIFVTWARADNGNLEGIGRYLMETLQPKVKRPAPFSPPIEVNLPGRPPLPGVPPPKPEATQPDQNWDDIAAKKPTPQQAAASTAQTMQAPATPKPAPMATPKPRKVSRLQTTVNAIIEKKNKGGAGGGFFGGGAKPKEDSNNELVKEVMDAIFQEAVGAGASDIHIEPLETVTRVRLRVDGMLDEALAVPTALSLRLVSYIRVACALDPEKGVGSGKPEDGRMAITVDGKEADLRLSTFPTPNGDKAVLRIIPRNTSLPHLNQLNMLPETITQVEDLAKRPQGMIVVTGPTGSGKSTTLYTILQILNDPTRNIVTLEDPIEKKVPGIIQGMVLPKTGFTFSNGLRAILRQDPNVIMVGEIRDVETAEIALSAALTGHMLLTTLHTNSALGAVGRLLDMGLEPFLISSALTAVFAQRLARKLCEVCRESGPITPAEKSELEALAKKAGLPLASLPNTAYRPKGCGSCRDTGYSGRLLIFEVVTLTPALRECILKKASTDEMKIVAIREGSVFLLADGLRKAGMGLTSIPEIARVVAND